MKVNSTKKGRRWRTSAFFLLVLHTGKPCLLFDYKAAFPLSHAYAVA